MHQISTIFPNFQNLENRESSNPRARGTVHLEDYLYEETQTDRMFLLSHDSEENL